MMLLRVLKWVGGWVFLPTLMCAAFIPLFGWNWRRKPVAHLALEKTGRDLMIGVAVQVSLGWPLLALSPLVEAGPPGMDSDCVRLIDEVQGKVAKLIRKAAR